MSLTWRLWERTGGDEPLAPLCHCLTPSEEWRWFCPVNRKSMTQPVLSWLFLFIKSGNTSCIFFFLWKAAWFFQKASWQLKKEKRKTIWARATAIFVLLWCRLELPIPAMKWVSLARCASVFFKRRRIQSGSRIWKWMRPFLRRNVYAMYMNAYIMCMMHTCMLTRITYLNRAYMNEYSRCLMIRACLHT